MGFGFSQKSFSIRTHLFSFLLVLLLLVLFSASTFAATLSTQQYNDLSAIMNTHFDYFLSSTAVTVYGMPVGAYKVGDRSRFGYSNPTEWGYLLQAYIAAAERGKITKSAALAKITTTLNTVKALQDTAGQNYNYLFYPYYKVTASYYPGVDVFPYHDSSPDIPSIDNGLFYQSLVIVDGWAIDNNYSALSTLSKSIYSRMKFDGFIFTQGTNKYAAHIINANTGLRGASKWDVYADEGGLMAVIEYLSGSTDLSTFTTLISSQMRSSATWNGITVKEAAWFSSMFTWGVRSLAGIPVIGTSYSKDSFVPATEAQLAYGTLLGVTYPGFSDAMTQGFVGYYLPPNLSGQVPSTAPAHSTPHAFFLPLNVLPDLKQTTLDILMTKISMVKDDNAGYYFNTGTYPFGFVVTTSPYANQTSYNGVNTSDGKNIFETLSQSYIALSAFNALQYQDGSKDFQYFLKKVPGVKSKVDSVQNVLYNIPIIVCSSDSECNDNNSNTQDICANAGTASSVCTYASIRCINDLQCNDNNSLTMDVCVNSGTSSSSCTNTPIAITCSSNVQCGADGYLGTAFCLGNNSTQTYRTYICSNGGTINSVCSSSDSNTTITACDSPQICNAGNCMTPACTISEQCGTNAFVGNAFCNTNDIWGTFRTFTCNNPGTISAACSSVDANQLKTSCSVGQICNNALCITPTCSTDLNCNDNNFFTFDKCINPGTISSSCTHQAIACLNDAACDDSNANTQDVCTNPGTISSACSYTPIRCINDSQCNDNNFLTTDVCLSPATTSSSCTNTPTASTCVNPISNMQVTSSIAFCPQSQAFTNMNIVADNVVVDCGNTQIFPGYNGTVFTIIDRNNVTIKNCRVTREANIIINIQRSKNIAIIDNNFSSSWDSSIYVTDSNFITITNNDVYGSDYGAAVYFSRVNDSLIQQNQLHDNGRVGTWYFAGGIYLESSQRNKIINNNIYDNKRAFEIRTSSNNIFTGNTLCTNYYRSECINATSNSASGNRIGIDDALECTFLANQSTICGQTCVSSSKVNGASVLCNCSDLQSVSNNLSGNYVLGQDINCSETKNWNGGAGFNPIGNSNQGFTGIFDGNRKIISDLYINKPSAKQVGLFVYTFRATIKDVGLVNSNITGGTQVGALTGFFVGSINNSYSTGKVNGIDQVGGLVGWNGGTISDSYSTANVSGTNNVGGLAGYSMYGECVINNSFSTGKIVGTGDNVGGLMGAFNGCKINNSSSVGSVIGKSNVGGLVGFSGVYGSLDGSLINNSYSAGDVNGASNVGGLVGNLDYYFKVNNSYSIGKVIGQNNVGGLVGYSPWKTVTNSFWDINSSGQIISAGGIGKTTSEMKTKLTFRDWDFNNNWKEVSNNYPILNWQQESAPLSVPALALDSASESVNSSPSVLSLNSTQSEVDCSAGQVCGNAISTVSTNNSGGSSGSGSSGGSGRSGAPIVVTIPVVDQNKIIDSDENVFVDKSIVAQLDSSSNQQIRGVEEIVVPSFSIKEAPKENTLGPTAFFGLDTTSSISFGVIFILVILIILTVNQIVKKKKNI
ncbi:MAG: GLUG motif-containing protein [archaeon]|jgi:parallel beta-helix repeat protein